MLIDAFIQRIVSARIMQSILAKIQVLLNVQNDQSENDSQIQYVHIIIHK